MSNMEELRARIEADAYRVDAEKVADAIVARLLAGQSARDSDK
jgi:anti-sigma28 factor (negative regulator of flagellin synthesis)